ncbi:ABC transporter permease [Streptomyces sp. KLOTTS4A1]|uniref:ABC transporter permease n=1 Tax=Streptomyces sp. KLOTTS4A1 TaxID=3390996 RepID=UPI0039F592C8
MTTVVADTSSTRSLVSRSSVGGGFLGLLRAEWVKIVSVRSTLWALLLMLVASVGAAVAASAVTVAGWDSASGESRAKVTADPLATIFSAFGVAELIVCVLGVLVITSEYSSSTIRASVLAVPRRTPVLAAKAAAFGLLTLAAGELTALASFFAGSAILQEHAPVALGDPEVLRVVLGSGLFLAAMGLFALGIGALVRHTAGAVAGVLGFLLVLAPLAGSLPASGGQAAAAYLPSNAGQLIVFAHPDPDAVLTPWLGLGVCALWSVAVLALASVLFKRRDV